VVSTGGSVPGAETLGPHGGPAHAAWPPFHGVLPPPLRTPCLPPSRRMVDRWRQPCPRCVPFSVPPGKDGVATVRRGFPPTVFGGTGDRAIPSGAERVAIAGEVDPSPAGLRPRRAAPIPCTAQDRDRAIPRAPFMERAAYACAYKREPAPRSTRSGIEQQDVPTWVALAGQRLPRLFMASTRPSSAIAGPRGDCHLGALVSALPKFAPLLPRAGHRAVERPTNHGDATRLTSRTADVGVPGPRSTRPTTNRRVTPHSSRT